MNIVYFPLATEQKEHFHVVSVTEDIIHFHPVGYYLILPQYDACDTDEINIFTK